MADLQGEASRSVPVRVWIGMLAPITAFIASDFARMGLDALRASDAMAFSFLFYLGLAAGVAWQSLHPRSLVHRFRMWGQVIASLALMGFLPGVTVEFSGTGGAFLVGLPVGVALTAWWFEERQARR